MPSNNTRVRADGAEPAYPAHDHQVAVKKQEGNWLVVQEGCHGIRGVADVYHIP